MKNVELEIVSRACAILGEGPIWDANKACLWWVDIFGETLHRFDPAPDSPNRETRWTLGCQVGAIAPCASARDGVVLVTAEGYVRFHPESGQRGLLASVENDVATNRMNDGKCDSRGRFWAGTMAQDESPKAGGLYVLDNGRARQVLTDVTVSNGIGWSPDDRLMYYVDSKTQRIDAFDFDLDAGALSDRRPFVEVAEADGLPDGLCVDREGCVWVALWGGGAVRRYSPDGRLDAEIETPVTHPTSVAFGGPQLTDLYITTARFALSESELRQQPDAGALFRCRPGATGMPPRVYRG